MEFDFIIPEFFDKEKFKINKELISNKLTKELISDSKKLEYIFKILLGSFNKKKKKPIGVFTENSVELFNSFVEKIEKYIERYLNQIHEVEISRAGLLDFQDYFDIQYDTDSQEQVYPDVYGEFENPSDSTKKKGKGKIPVKNVKNDDKFGS
jgi:hypothetical protein